MALRGNKDTFVKKAFLAHGDKYDYLESIYVNAKTKVKIFCKKHSYLFLQTPDSHIRGSGCPKCGQEVINNATTWNLDRFIKEARGVWGDEFDYSNSVYKSYNEKVNIIHKTCGKEFRQTPHNHLAGHGCMFCESKKRGIKRIKECAKDFIRKAIEVHGNNYTYDKVNYEKCDKVVSIKHNKCGKYFLQTPQCHLSGSGCPLCAKWRLMTQEEFIEKVTLVHGEEAYDYSKMKYKGRSKKIKIKHNKCDTWFKQLAGNHISGEGCPGCQESKGEREVAKILNKKEAHYEKQKSFDGCINPKTNRVLRFDFYVKEKNLLIEYDGEFHYQDVKFKNSITSLKAQKYRDGLKNEFAEKEKIRLLRIPYFEIKNLEKLLNEALAES